MIEILTNIISDLTCFTYIKGIELSFNALTVLILSFTLYFAIKYTKASEKQTSELIKQNELATLPSLTYEFFEKDAQTYGCLRADEILHEIIIRNVGTGPALNFFFSFKEDVGKKSIDSLREEIPFLSAGDTKKCDFSEYNLLKNPDKNKIYYFCFYFSDIQGNFFRQNHLIIKGRRRFVRPITVNPEKETIENLTVTINMKDLIPTIFEDKKSLPKT